MTSEALDLEEGVPSVAGVFDIAQRAAQYSGEPVSIYAVRETHDGVEHVRLKSEDVDLLMPATAFRILANYALGPTLSAEVKRLREALERITVGYSGAYTYRADELRDIARAALSPEAGQ